jgi:hypothetical protein
LTIEKFVPQISVITRRSASIRENVGMGKVDGGRGPFRVLRGIPAADYAKGFTKKRISEISRT